jgi:DNA-binding PucR family transcriptional regulator
MQEPAVSAGQPETDEDQVIRDQVRAVTNQVLRQGRVDPEALRNVVRTLAGQRAGHAAPDRGEAREHFADAVKSLDETLQTSAAATHEALQRLASRGKDYTDNDLKDALVSLSKLEQHCGAATSRIAEAMSDNWRGDVASLAAHAQDVGAEASARAATLLGEVGSRVGESAASGLEAVRGASARFTLLASGVLAGVADALRDQNQTKKGD